MYRMHVKGISIVLVVFLFVAVFGACNGDDDENDDPIDPDAEPVLTVTETDPSNGSLGVPIDVQISVTFSEDVDPRTITDSSFMLLVKDVSIPGDITWLENVVTFTPLSPLAPNTTYTGRVTTAVRDFDQNPLFSDFIWSFTTL